MKATINNVDIRGCEAKTNKIDIDANGFIVNPSGIHE